MYHYLLSLHFFHAPSLSRLIRVLDVDDVDEAHPVANKAKMDWEHAPLPTLMGGAVESTASDTGGDGGDGGVYSDDIMSTAYDLFVSAHTSTVKEEHPGMNDSSISLLLDKQWSDSTQEVNAHHAA